MRTVCFTNAKSATGGFDRPWHDSVSVFASRNHTTIYPVAGARRDAASEVLRKEVLPFFLPEVTK